jgi:spermidine synthase
MTVADTLRPADSLVIGGGTFTFPHALARKYPDSRVVAVEIDPALTEIARQHFNLRDRDNLSIVNADGRVYINHPTDDATFDVVYIDAFSSLTPPYQLMTAEAVAGMRNALKPGGSVIATVIAVPQSEYLSSVVSTYREQFDVVEVYQYSQGAASDGPQNVLLLATDQKSTRQRLDTSLASQRLTVGSARPLTDNYAPVEQLVEAQ